MALLDKKEIEELVQRMMEAYPDARCALDHGDRFQLLVAVVLSAQTTDISVNQVTPALFAKAPDAFAMAAMPEEEISEIIRTIGMYRTKAHNVKALSAALVEKYDGEVPGDYDRLVELPGVGRKTANVVLAEAFGQQRIAVDTHVFRLANRIGLVCEKDVVKTEEGLMKVLPEDHWTAMHHALIWHGRRVCTARKPDCENCCIEGVCRRNGL
ncbi:MAG: endonuclease III [Firmicutes bacterium]|nr:endonuclease III [Bacillota bacterium]